VIETITVLGIGVGLLVGGLEIWRHFKPQFKAEILNPSDSSECGGREVTVSGVVPRRRWRTHYWLAIQPSGNRGSGTWWPQRQRLTFGRRGTWILERATLGRKNAVEDIGSTYTLGLFEVLPGAQKRFSDMANQGERLKLADVSEHCSLLHSVEVKRVRH
jgi:hypothetical protein